MGTVTPNLGLEKPDIFDQYDIELNNRNLDRIDAAYVRKPIPDIPAQSGTLTYTGNPLTPTWSNYDPAQLLIGGVASATNAGTYTATFTPMPGYEWWDGTLDAKNANWSIGKASGSLSISPTSLTLDASNLSRTIAVTRAGDGTITAQSSNTGVATASVSGTTVTVTHVNQTSGSATITVKVAAGTNHTAPSDKTCAVTASFLPVKQALNNMTWADISKVCKAGQASSYWAVGDTKSMTFNGASYYCQIIGFDHDNPTNTTTYGRSKAGVTLQFGIANKSGGGTTNAGMFATTYPMNASNVNNTGWTNSVMRTSTMPLMKGYLPADLQAVLVPVNKLSSAGNQSTTINTTSDELFLFSENELFGSVTYAVTGEGTQYAFYSAGNSRVRYNTGGSTDGWWERSPYASYATNFCFVSANGNANSTAAAASYGVSFGFCI